MLPVIVGLIVPEGELRNEVCGCLRSLPVRVYFEDAGLPDPPAVLSRITELKPAALLIDFTAVGRPAGDLLALLKTVPNCPSLLGIYNTDDANRILSLIRAGADDVLIPPLGPDLKQALDRISRQRFADGPRAKVLGFVSAKGGCGATIIASRVATELKGLSSTDTKDVLLVELDTQLGSIRALTGADTQYSFGYAATNLHRLDLSYWDRLVSACGEGIEVLPNGVNPGSPVPAAVDDQCLSDALEFARYRYRWIVVDFGRGLNPYLQSLLGRVDELFLVTTLDRLALYRAKQLIIEVLANAYNHNRIRLSLNRLPNVDRRRQKEIEDFFSVRVASQIPECNELRDFDLRQFLTEPCAFGSACRALALSIAGIEDAPPTTWFSLSGLKRLAARAASA